MGKGFEVVANEVYKLALETTILTNSINDIVNESWPSSWGMYFFVLEDLSTNEIVSTCRFGGTIKENEEKIWDFGYSTFRGDDKENYTLEDIREVFKNGVKK